MNLLAIFSKTVVAGAIAIASMVGLHQHTATPQSPAPVLGTYSTAAGGTYRLQTSLGTTDTTIRLSSFKDPRNNANLTMTYLNTSIAYGTLDPQQPTRSELISFTGITQNSDGTASLTGVTRGLLGVYPYTASSTLRKTHSGQSIFILSDAPQVFNEFPAKQNTETITGAWTFASSTFNGSTTIANGATSTFNGPVTFNASTTHNAITQFNASTTFTLTPVSAVQPTLSTQVANKAYVDGVALVSAPNADTTTKGVAEEATAAEVAAGTATGGTGARLFVNPSTASNIVGIVGTIASSTTYASSSMAQATTTIFTITSTSSTQRINIWAKAQSDSTSNTVLYYLYYATSSNATILLDTISTYGGATARPGFSLVATYLPTATGTVQFVSTGTTVSYFQALLQIIR